MSYALGMEKRKGIIIYGPTASGKSSLGIELARDRDGIIVNADSLQVYKDLPVLTACPPPEDLEKVQHYLYTFLAGDDNCSAGRYLSFVKELLDREERLPIIVGGTGLYLKSLLEGYSPMPEISEDIRKEARSKDIVEIAAYVAERDKDFAHKDQQRLRRAYEVIRASSKSYSYWIAQPKIKLIAVDFEFIKLSPPREELYKRCDLRFEQMLEQGAIEEVEALMYKNYPPDATIMKAVGVAEISAYLAGEMTREQMVAKAQQKTRNYAKRQLTWLRTQFAY